MNESIKDQIIKNSFWSIISSFINRIGSFILIVIISRLLMPEGFGKYSLAMTVALFLITFSDVGINQTLIRYVSLHINKRDGNSTSYFRHLFKIKFFIVLIVSLILFSIAYPLSNFIFHEPSLFFPFIILSFYIFIVSITSFFESLFFIKKYVKYISIKESISLIIKILFLILIGYFVRSKFQISGIFLAFAIISFFMFILVFFLSKHFYPSLFRRTTKIIDKKQIGKFILFLNMQNISWITLSQASIIFMGIFLAKEFVGYFNSSLVLITGIISLLFSFSYTFIPIFASTDKETFQNLLKKIFRLFLILALPISFGLSFLSKFFITHIYGKEYFPASISLKILAFLVPCIMGIDLALASFSARNKQKKFAISMVIFASIFIFLNYILMKFLLPYSQEIILKGISILNLTIWSFCLLYAIFLIKKEFNVNVVSFWIWKPLISCMIMSSFIFFVLKILPEINILFGILVIALSAMIYIFSLFLFKGITKEDLTLIKRIIFKK